jgi:hypothetical protein
MHPTEALTILIAMIGCSACTPQLPTVAGPESKQLAPRVDGHLVWIMPRGEIAAISPGVGARWCAV